MDASIRLVCKKTNRTLNISMPESKAKNEFIKNTRFAAAMIIEQKGNVMFYEIYYFEPLFFDIDSQLFKK